MAYLLDTNVAIRCVFPSDPQYQVIREAVLRLILRGERIVICAQVLGEAWSLCTRPSKERGGYGLKATEADEVIADIISLAALVPEPPDLWQEQHRLLVACGVSGVETHDCRLAAWCRLWGIDNLLTLNVKDFTRYGIRAVHPKDV